MLKRLFWRKEPILPPLPHLYHWRRWWERGGCAAYGKNLYDQFVTTVAWTRPNEAEPRDFGPVGLCCALRFWPWPDADVFYRAIHPYCMSCGVEMSPEMYGVDAEIGSPWFEFRCCGGINAEDGAEGCGNRVHLSISVPAAYLFDWSAPLS